MLNQMQQHAAAANMYSSMYDPNSINHYANGELFPINLFVMI